MDQKKNKEVKSLCQFDFAFRIAITLSKISSSVLKGDTIFFSIMLAMLMAFSLATFAFLPSNNSSTVVEIVAASVENVLS